MKKAIVVGATSGIGLEVSNNLIKNGYKVGITGIEKSLLEDFKIENQNNIQTKYIDGTKDNTSEKIEELIQSIGGLDLLVFCAGIGNLNKDIGYTVENKANLLNVIAFTEIIDWTYRYFDKQGYGHIVGISSLAGLFGFRKAPAYHAAKAYQINYLAGLRQKAKHSKKPIYITDVRPGFVKTAMMEGKKTFWVATKEKAGKQIYNSITKKRNIVYVSRRWKLIGILIHFLPNWVLNKL